VKTAEVGTYAQIIDWYTLEDGLLGVSATGTVRFITENAWQEDDGLFRAQVQVLSEPPSCRVPEAFSILSDVLARFMEKLDHQYPEYTPAHLQDALWVGYRMSELLPLSGIEKQHLLELADPLDRLQGLIDIIPRFQSA